MLKFISNIIIILVLFLLNGINTYGNNTNECVSKYGYSSYYDQSNSKCECVNNYELGKDYKGETKCVSKTQVCKNSYGIMGIYDTSSNKCGCYGLYVLVDNQCEYGPSLCASKIGYGSFYDTNNNSCECKEGYNLLNGKCTSNQQQCITELGYWSTFNSNSNTCECKEGYNLLNGKCISNSQQCMTELGYWSTFNSNSNACECKEGYNLLNGKCISNSQQCMAELGYGGIFNNNSNTCECNNGYTLLNNKCVSNQQKCTYEQGYGSYYNNTDNKCSCKEGFTLSNGKCENSTIMSKSILSLFKSNNLEEINTTKNKLRDGLFKKFNKKNKSKLLILSNKLDKITYNYIIKKKINQNTKSKNLIILISFSDLLKDFIKISSEGNNKKVKSISENNTTNKSVLSKKLDNSSTIKKWGNYYYEKKEFTKAILYYKSILNKEGIDIEVLNKLFISYIYTDNFTEAYKIIFILYKISPNKEQVIGYKISENNLTEKIKLKKIEFSNRNKNNVERISIEYAKLLYKAGDYYYYENQIKNFLPIMSSYLASYNLLDDLLVDYLNNDQALFLQGRLLMDINGNFELAQEKLEKAVKINDKDFNYYYRLGNAFMHQDKYMEAKVQFLKGIDLEKKYEKLYLNLGNMYFKLNEDTKGFETYKKGIKICTNFCDGFYSNMGNEYYRNGDNEKATIWYEKVSSKYNRYNYLQDSIKTLKNNR